MSGRYTPKGRVLVGPDEARRMHRFHCCEGSVALLMDLCGWDSRDGDLRGMLRDMRADCPLCRVGDVPVHSGRECR